MRNIEPGSYEDRLRAELSRKLSLLMDIRASKEGENFTFTELAEALKEQGVSLSRQRWSYMLNGSGPVVTNPRLLKALADVFHVPPSYLVPGGEGPTPERIESQLSAIRAMKHSRLKILAARELGEVSPKTLEAITKLLNMNIDDEEGRSG